MIYRTGTSHSLVYMYIFLSTINHDLPCDGHIKGTYTLRLHETVYIHILL